MPTLCEGPGNGPSERRHPQNCPPWMNEHSRSIIYIGYILGPGFGGSFEVQSLERSTS